MKNVRFIAEKLGISVQRLQYWLNKPDSPMYEMRMERKRKIRFYDEDEVCNFYKER